MTVHYVKRQSPLVMAVLILAALPWVPSLTGEDRRAWLVAAALLAGMSVAFDFTAGYIGIVNFGFAAFTGLGAYSSALVGIHYGVPPWLAMVVGAVGSAVLGFLVGAVTLRFRGIYASIVPWFLSLALLGVTRNWTGLTRGPLGISVPTLLDSPSSLPYYYVVAGMLVVTFVVLRGVIDSRTGLAFRAIGQNMGAASASGINPARFRIINFVLSCLFAGWLGGFYGAYYGILTPDIMSTAQTVTVLVAAYLGGRGTLWGPAVAAFPISLGSSWMSSNLTDRPGLNLVIYGVVLILVMLYFPTGLAGLLGRARVLVVERFSVGTRKPAELPHR